MSSDKPLAGKIALVAGATRGAGRAFAIELGAKGATVYATGRTTRNQRSEIDRPETIEDTADLVTEAGGTGIAIQCDHLQQSQVRDLVSRIDSEQGRLDILINNIWGGDHLTGWDKKLWEHDLDDGFRLLRLAVETHLNTSHFAIPLLIRNPGGLVMEVTDGTSDYNRTHYRESMFYDLAKTAPQRIAFGLSHELKDSQATAVCLSPGWIRSEAMLDTHFKVSEENWRDGAKQDPNFLISETPRFVGRAAAALAADPQVARWNGQTLSSFQLSQEYGFTDVDGSQPDAWGYITQVREAGKPADVTGYR